jgi:translation elongation factor EF-G
MTLVATGNAKVAKQTGGRGQYGHVVLRLIVNGPHAGLTIGSSQLGESVPAQYVPAIEAGIRAFVAEGALATRGYVDARVELIDGSYHDVDSSDVAFYTAAVMAMDQALRALPSTPGESSGGEDSPGVRAPVNPRRPNPASAIALPEPDDDSRRWRR